MKYLALALALFASTANGAVTQAWPLNDDAASTTVVATTGTNGTLTGGDNTETLQTSSGPGGSINYAFDLDGSADYVDFSASSVSFLDTEAFSFSCWFNLDALSNEALVGKAASAIRYIRVSDSTTITVYIGGGSSGFTVPTISTGVWYHLLVTRTTGNSVRVFLNGTESSSGPQTLAGVFDPNAIGRTSLVFADGRISEPRIYNSDESANVATIYAEGVASGSPVPAIVQQIMQRRR